MKEIDKNYTYCKISNGCPIGKYCKRYLEKEHDFPLGYITPKHKTMDDYMKCTHFELKKK